MSSRVNAIGLEGEELKKESLPTWRPQSARQGYPEPVFAHAVLHAKGWDMEGDYSAACPECRRAGSGVAQDAPQAAQEPPGAPQ